MSTEGVGDQVLHSLGDNIALRTKLYKFMITRNVSEMGHRWLCISDDGLRCLPSFSHLKYLSLEGSNTITDSSVCVLLTRCQQLTHLDLSWCRHLSDVSAVHISTLTALRTLNLAVVVQLTQESLLPITHSCTLLTNLDFAKIVGVTDNVVKNIAIHCTNLRCLNVARGSITEDGVLVLITLL